MSTKYGLNLLAFSQKTPSVFILEGKVNIYPFGESQFQVILASKNAKRKRAHP